MAGNDSMRGSARTDGDQARRVAKEALGIVLTPPQEAAIASVTAGHDTLLIMPTGSGKSAIYQVAGEMIDGPTIIVSPLIALQHDQLRAIEGSGLHPGAVLNSALGVRARAEVLTSLRAGELEFLLLAPEQLAQDELVHELASAGPSLMVVDEAHCICSWGHDVRPDYLRLGEVRRRLGMPRVLALTATANPHARDEITAQLSMRDPKVIVGGFERDNLHVSVRAGGRDEVVAAVDGLDGSGLVYVATRRMAQELADALSTPERPASAFHSAMSTSAKAAVQERFAAEESSVVVATTAFGMGIDVPHVRFVIHLDAPESIDAYYQEIGRGGRDGESAEAILFHTPARHSSRAFAAGGAPPSVEECVAVDRYLHSPRTGRLGVGAAARTLGMSTGKFVQALTLLQQTGRVGSDPHRTALGADDIDAETIGGLASITARIDEIRRSRASMMERFVSLRTCRWSFMLGYFGDPHVEPCGHCDNCDSAARAGSTEDAESAERPGCAVSGYDPSDGVPTGEAVIHEAFGPGLVVHRDGDIVTVLFDEHGYKTLSWSLLEAGGLLSTAPAG